MKVKIILKKDWQTVKSFSVHISKKDMLKLLFWSIVLAGRKSKPVELLYTVPEYCSGMTKITYTIDADDCKVLWDRWEKQGIVIKLSYCYFKFTVKDVLIRFCVILMLMICNYSACFSETVIWIWNIFPSCTLKNVIHW